MFRFTDVYSCSMAKSAYLYWHHVGWYSTRAKSARSFRCVEIALAMVCAAFSFPQKSENKTWTSCGRLRSPSWKCCSCERLCSSLNRFIQRASSAVNVLSLWEKGEKDCAERAFYSSFFWLYGDISIFWVLEVVEASISWGLWTLLPSCVSACMLPPRLRPLRWLR